MKAVNHGGGLAAASAIATQVDKRLSAIERALNRLVEFFEGKHYFELEWSVNTLKEELSKGFSEQIPQGYIFIPQRISVQGPEGSRLQLFSNTESAANFLEVITNVQEFSEGILGPWMMFGPGRILAVVTKAKVAGTTTITLSGNLIPREPGKIGHIP